MPRAATSAPLLRPHLACPRHPKKKKPAGGVTSADTRALERTLTEFLGLRVVINSKGKAGSITIHYQSLDQLDELLTRITGAPKV